VATPAGCLCVAGHKRQAARLNFYEITSAAGMNVRQRTDADAHRGLPWGSPYKEFTMSKTDFAVAVYDNHGQAETAVKDLAKAGFDMKTISILGRDYHTEEHVVGYLNAGDRAKFFGKLGAFWGGLAGPYAVSCGTRQSHLARAGANG